MIVKAYYSSVRIPQAKAAGFRIFSYLSPSDMDEATIAAAAARLDRNDLLVLPADPGDYVTYYPDELIAAAKAHRVPLVVYPIHRRADAEHYFKLGVSGAVTSDYGYTSTTTASYQLRHLGQQADHLRREAEDARQQVAVRCLDVDQRVRP